MDIALKLAVTDCAWFWLFCQVLGVTSLGSVGLTCKLRRVVKQAGALSSSGNPTRGIKNGVAKLVGKSAEYQLFSCCFTDRRH